MAKVAYRTILKDFEISFGESRYEFFKAGEVALCLPNLDRESEYCIASDFHVPVWVDKKYLSERFYNSLVDEL